MYPNYVTVSVYFCAINSALSGKEKQGSSVMEIHMLSGYTGIQVQVYNTSTQIYRYKAI